VHLLGNLLDRKLFVGEQQLGLIQTPLLDELMQASPLCLEK
jgi:hypothetical protein